MAQGFQTTDEMCMFIGAYWPRSQAMDSCGPSFRPPGTAGRPLAHGTKNGADYKACMAAHTLGDVYGSGPATSDTRFATQTCVTDLCPEVSGHV